MRTYKRLKEFEIMIENLNKDDAMKSLNMEIKLQKILIEKHKKSKQIQKYKDILKELKEIKKDVEKWDTL